MHIIKISEREALGAVVLYSLIEKNKVLLRDDFTLASILRHILILFFVHTLISSLDSWCKTVLLEPLCYSASLFSRSIQPPVTRNVLSRGQIDSH